MPRTDWHVTAMYFIPVSEKDYPGDSRYDISAQSICIGLHRTSPNDALLFQLEVDESAIVANGGRRNATATGNPWA